MSHQGARDSCLLFCVLEERIGAITNIIHSELNDTRTDKVKSATLATNYCSVLMGGDSMGTMGTMGDMGHMYPHCQSKCGGKKSESSARTCK